MPRQRIEIDAKAQELMRAQYDAGVPTDAIARTFDIAASTLRRRILEWGWPARPRFAPSASTPAAVTARVHELVERELDAVEHILATLGPVEPGATEGKARTVATLARTLRELMRLHPAGPSPRGGADDEPEIRDLDEFRRDLACRLDRLVADAKAACPDPVER